MASDVESSFVWHCSGITVRRPELDLLGVEPRPKSAQRKRGQRRREIAVHRLVGEVLGLSKRKSRRGSRELTSRRWWSHVCGIAQQGSLLRTRCSWELPARAAPRARGRFVRVSRVFHGLSVGYFAYACRAWGRAADAPPVMHVALGGSGCRVRVVGGCSLRVAGFAQRVSRTGCGRRPTTCCGFRLYRDSVDVDERRRGPACGTLFAVGQGPLAPGSACRRRGVAHAGMG